MIAVTLAISARCWARGEDVGQAVASAAQGVGQVLGDLADLVAELLGVGREVQGEPAGRVDDVLAQPWHCRELHPVGLLVQADPEPEVRRVDAELGLGVQHVGRHQQQAGGAVGGEVVLAQDPAGQEGGERANLGTGDLAADTQHQGRAGDRVLALGEHGGDDRLEHGLQGVDVGVDPARTIHDQDSAAVLG